jgi:hypothetical protein
LGLKGKIFFKVKAENLPGTLFLYEESEIEVPSRSVDLPNSDMIGFYRY